jgi:uncharacterized membrane protein
MRVLLAGESWVTHSVHVKGVDSFDTSTYGRSGAFASDCAPHWCPPAFMDWPGYNPLWGNLLRWLSGQ